MKKIRIGIIYILSAILTIGFVQAQDVISAKELQSYLKQNNTILISAQKAEEYNKIHITGAINIDHNLLYDDMTMLLSEPQIAQIFGVNGVSQKMKIVLYDEGSSKYSGRMYWILDYMGAEDVKILDGGLKAWKTARKPVTRTAATAKAVTFTPNVNKSYLATMETVKKAINNPAYVIIDARTPEEFNGTNETSLRLGHIHSAVNINYLTLLNAKGELKSNEELTTLFTKAGVTKNKRVIVYCKTSVRAGIEFLALKSALGYPSVMVYDGAFKEWQSKTSNKVTM
jgi:thiosulfate/3-mercaptopyruvate sulfurtransferase